MDEQNTNQAPVQNQEAAPTPVTPSASGVVYAGFFERFIAALIDGILVGVVTGLLGSLFGFTNSSEQASFNPFFILGLAYYVVMTYKYGYTLGKKVMKIRVQKEDTGQNLTIVDAILREVVGKFVSSFLLLGYFWMLWDSKKQTWHDKIAKSIVVKA
ncbi:MAG: RDD family protein [Candidatus Gracilibacteria bacterium]|jgi:uncharacterized RDD family membrane protein YckC